MTDLNDVLIAAIGAIVSIATLASTVFIAIRVNKVKANVEHVEEVVNSKNTILTDTIESLKAEVSALNADRGHRTPASVTTPSGSVGIAAGHVTVSKTEPKGG